MCKGLDSFQKVAERVCCLGVELTYSVWCLRVCLGVGSYMGSSICHLLSLNGIFEFGNLHANLSFRYFCNWLKLPLGFLTCHSYHAAWEFICASQWCLLLKISLHTIQAEEDTHFILSQGWVGWGRIGGKGRREIPKEYCFYSFNVPQLHFLSSCAHFLGLSFSVTISTSSRGQLMEGYLASPFRVSKCYQAPSSDSPLRNLLLDHWGIESQAPFRGSERPAWDCHISLSPCVSSCILWPPRCPSLQKSRLAVHCSAWLLPQGSGHKCKSVPARVALPIINEVWPWASRLTSLHLGFSSVKCEAWTKLVVFKLYSLASPQGDWSVSVCVCV